DSMSGGCYEYAYARVIEMAEAMESDGLCDSAGSALRELFRAHLHLVAKAMQAIEWNDSCDGDSHEKDLIVACLRLSLVEWSNEHPDKEGVYWARCRRTDGTLCDPHPEHLFDRGEGISPEFPRWIVLHFGVSATTPADQLVWGPKLEPPA